MTQNPIKTINIQGHRGCRGLLPENTIESFKKAIELGVHTLELDVAVSKDNLVVVSHEPFISRKTCLDINGNKIPKEDDKKYNLYNMPFEEIKLFDSGSKKHKKFHYQKNIETYKPTLFEVIQTCDALNNNIKYNIEFKARPEYDNNFTPGPKQFVNLVLNTISEVSHRTNLQSFDLRILEEINKQSSDIDVAILINKDEDISVKLERLSYKPEIVSPYFKLLSFDKVIKYQNEGFKVIPWTVNKEKHLKRMIDFNVDGIITDYPDRLIELLKIEQECHTELVEVLSKDFYS